MQLHEGDDVAAVQPQGADHGTPPGLTWALVLSTYMRADILEACVRCAIEQTRPPIEVVVVDASPNWEESRARVQKRLANLPQPVRLVYVKSEVAGLCTQRNVGVRLSTADVVFLIDDDSLMYPDCAAEVMAVYEADTDGAVLGVCPIGGPDPPGREGESDIAVAPSVHPRQTLVRRMAKALLNTQTAEFQRYDRDPPRHPVPAAVAALDASPIEYAAGYRMTFRRSILLREKFSEFLVRYAAGEDQDLCYRVTRHGLLMNAGKARLCHLEFGSGRLSPRVVAALAALNPAAMQVVYASDLAWVKRAWRAKLRKRLLISALKELADRKFAFDRTLGTLFALRHLDDVYGRTRDEIATWYPAFQTKIIEGR